MIRKIHVLHFGILIFVTFRNSINRMIIFKHFDNHPFLGLGKQMPMSYIE